MVHRSRAVDHIQIDERHRLDGGGQRRAAVGAGDAGADGRQHVAVGQGLGDVEAGSAREGGRG